MQIRTVIGGIATGLALTAGLAAPAAATDPAQPTVACTVTTDGKATADISADGGVWKCDGSAKTWNFTKTDVANGADQKNGQANAAKGDNNTQTNQSCQVQGQVSGSVYCVNINGSLVTVQAPSACNGQATCGTQLPAEIPAAAAKATCNAAGQKIETTVNGVKVIGTCKAAGAATVPVTKAAVTDDSLPVTGAKSLIMFAVALAAIGIGFALFLVTRRRRVSFTA